MKTPAATKVTTSAPSKAKSIGVGCLLKQRNTARAEVLSYLLNHQRITGMDAVFKASTTRLSAVIFALEGHGWTIDREDHVVGCKDGRVSTVTRYWLPPATIEAAAAIGADAWRQEVRAARAELRRKAAEAMQEAQRQNQRAVHRAARRAAPGQSDLFAEMGLANG
jgi:hypothetical protein